MKKTAEMNVAEMNAALFGTSDARAISTRSMVQKMLDSGDGISDLVFSPGRRRRLSASASWCRCRSRSCRRFAPKTPPASPAT
jgi:hypothetical protein